VSDGISATEIARRQFTVLNQLMPEIIETLQKFAGHSPYRLAYRTTAQSFWYCAFCETSPSPQENFRHVSSCPWHRANSILFRIDAIMEGRGR